MSGKIATVDALAQEIRRVDGNHELGAGALAEALMPFIAALSSVPAIEGGEVKDGDSSPIEYVLRYGGRCRECADTRVDGICDHSGIPCDVKTARKAIAHVISALRYGVAQGYLANPFISPPSSSVEELRAENERLRKALQEARDCLDGEPTYHHEGMGCGLEDRNIRDRYEAMEHGWDCAIGRVYSEHINGAVDVIDASLSNVESK